MPLFSWYRHSCNPKNAQLENTDAKKKFKVSCDLYIGRQKFQVTTN